MAGSWTLDNLSIGIKQGELRWVVLGMIFFEYGEGYMMYNFENIR